MQKKATNGSKRVLELLQAAAGEWVGDLYQRTGTMVHSRISDLRKQGYPIECKMFSQGDYRYRLAV